MPRVLREDVKELVDKFPDLFCVETEPHLVFGNIDIRISIAVNTLMGFYYHKNIQTRDKIYATEEFLSCISDVINIHKPAFIYDPNLDESCGGGLCLQDINTIIVKKFSVMTLLHEFRHIYQAQKNMNPFESELDAYSWSHSVFYLANKEAYQNALDKGLFHIQTSKLGGINNGR
jgi:hypothetical protein